MFRLIGTVAGLVLTVGSIYVAQKSAGENLQNDEELKDISLAGRVVSGFAAAVIVGGTVNKIIRSVFD